jgi:hypothetical protein
MALLFRGLALVLLPPPPGLSQAGRSALAVMLVAVALWTPIAGARLNLAESLQRILVRRALAGQHPKHTDELMAWLAEAVVGWNAGLTPFEWGGQRAARRRRARERHRLGGSGGYTRRPISRCRHIPAHAPRGHDHGN